MAYRDWHLRRRRHGGVGRSIGTPLTIVTLGDFLSEFFGHRIRSLHRRAPSWNVFAQRSY
jgi:hypothetical protein